MSIVSVRQGKVSRWSTTNPNYVTAFTVLTENELMLHCICLTFSTPFNKMGHIDDSSCANHHVSGAAPPNSSSIARQMLV
jgi:hypothetical protein